MPENPTLNTVKRIVTKGILLLVVVLSAREYARWTWDNPTRAQFIVQGWTHRPFAYRVLIPWLARVLVWLGLKPEQALTFLVTLSAVGLVYGIHYLLTVARRRST